LIPPVRWIETILLFPCFTIPLQKGFGMADSEHDVPIPPQSNFHLASHGLKTRFVNTKPIFRTTQENSGNGLYFSV
jgi:hypothetical protein